MKRLLCAISQLSLTDCRQSHDQRSENIDTFGKQISETEPYTNFQMMDAKLKAGRYLRIYNQIQTLLAKPGNDISKLSTIVAVLHNKFDYFFWTGFYLLHNGKLVAGPYQGPVACQVLEKDKGVCWAAINSGHAIIVPDVNNFPGHIACDSRSKSEIAIPLKNNEFKIIGVLDVDSKALNSFDEIDREGLEKILSLPEINCATISGEAKLGISRVSQSAPH